MVSASGHCCGDEPDGIHTTTRTSARCEKKWFRRVSSTVLQDHRLSMPCAPSKCDGNARSRSAGSKEDSDRSEAAYLVDCGRFIHNGLGLSMNISARHVSLHS